MEDQLGCKLFNRSKKGLTPTAEGNALKQYVEKAFGLIVQGENKLAEIQGLKAGEITIGASDTLCANYLLKYLILFKEKYPNIKIRITNRTSFETIDLLLKGAIDFGFINLPYKTDNLIKITETMIINDCLIYGEKFKDKLNHKTLKIKDIPKFPLVLLEKASNSRRFLDAFFKTKGIILEPELELGSNDLLVQFIENGFGLSIMPEEFIKKELAERKIYKVNLKEGLPQRGIGLITLQNVELPVACQKFISLL